MPGSGFSFFLLIFGPLIHGIFYQAITHIERGINDSSIHVFYNLKNNITDEGAKF